MISAIQIIKILSLCLIVLNTPACGRNAVEKYAPDNDQEKAELDMEANRYSDAIQRLNRVLEGEPENYPARSLLAAAFAAQAGLSALDLIKNATSGASSGQSGLKAVTSLLPTATAESLSLMNQACNAMESIPVTSRTAEMKLQHGLFFSSYALLQIKFFIDNPLSIESLSVEDAAKLIVTLAKAAEAGGSSPISTALRSFSSGLDQASGSSLERVKSVLTANSAPSGGSGG
jgi:hypothetical protein